MRLLFGVGLALTLLAAAPASAQNNNYGSNGLPPNYWADYPAPAQTTTLQGSLPADNGAVEGVAQCDTCMQSGCSCSDRWFGSLGGLIMGRDNANTFWTSFETNNNANQVMNTDDAKANWGGGFDLTLGYWFNCGQPSNCCGDARNGMEVVYFFVDPMNGYSSVLGSQFASGTVSTTIDLQDPGTASGNVEIGGTDSATYFDNATEHRIWRHDEVQDLEINFLHEKTNSDSLQLTWLGGIRYFNFSDRTIFGSVGNGSQFGQNGGADEAYLNIRCNNSLIGPQIGVRADYQWFQNVGLYLQPVVGIYGNQVSQRVHLYSGDGLEGYDIHGDGSRFSFLAQIDAGINYQMTSHWRAFMGYRVVAVSGVALSDTQFPHYLAATDELAVPDSNGDLILHGGIGGLEFTY